jgi:hypothetical protein
MEVQLDLFKEIAKPVVIDWEYALQAVENIDTSAIDEVEKNTHNNKNYEH